jgi:hypothetical protein
MLRKQCLLFLAVLLTSCLFFLAATEKSFSGMPPIGTDCCEANGSCFNLTPLQECLGEVFEGASCNEQTGMCVQRVAPIASPIPTLSEWGLIAMAAVLGIAGYLIVRRRRVST